MEQSKTRFLKLNFKRENQKYYKKICFLEQYPQVELIEIAHKKHSF